jgi:4-carboxymuconolactone decarboxylase
VTGRLPILKPADLDEAQRSLYDSLISHEIRHFERAGVEAIARDGGLLGPFNPLLFSPSLGAAQIGVFRADQASTSLSRRVHEIVVLAVGEAMNSDYELYAHGIIGGLAGLPEDVIRDLASGRPPDLDDEREATALEFTRQLTNEHRVEAETYRRATAAFGHKGVVDLVMLIGLYLTTCSIINAFDVRAPEAVR